MSNRKFRVLIAFNEPEEKSPEDWDYISEAAVKDEAEVVYQAILKLGHVPHFLPIKSLEGAIKATREFQPDLIFNLCEGFRGQAKYEMHITGIWELLALPYTGNSALVLGLAQDKILAKQLFQAQKILTPAYQVFTEPPEAVALDYPVIAKPSREDASLGITQKSVIHNLADLQAMVQTLLKKYRQPILVEKYIAGREFNIGVLGNSPARVLPISEISFTELEAQDAAITSYEAKWLVDHRLYQKTPPICPAPISEALKQRLEETALRVYQVLKGRDYGRIDVRVDSDENIYVLEYNPNPDISAEAGYTRALKAAGIIYKEFIDLLLHETIGRKRHD